MKLLTAAVVCVAFGATSAAASCPGMASKESSVDKLAQTLTPKPLISSPKTGS